MKKEAYLLQKVDRLFQTVDEFSKSYKELKKIIIEPDSRFDSQERDQSHTREDPGKKAAKSRQNLFRNDIRLTGVSFGNCQSVIQSLRPDEEIRLLRRPSNPYDSSAIAVLKISTGEQFGWIPRDYSAGLAAMMDRGVGCRAELLSIKNKPGGLYGVVVRVYTNEILEPAKLASKTEDEKEKFVMKNKTRRFVSAKPEMEDITEFIEDDDLFKNYLED